LTTRLARRRQALVQALVFEGELFMVQAELMQDGGVQIRTWTGFSAML